MKAKIQINADDMAFAEIRKVMLIGSHIPGCIVLVVDHHEKWNYECDILGVATDLVNKVVTIDFSKIMGDGVEHQIAVRFHNLSPHLIDLLDSSLRFVLKAGDQQLFLFAPMPYTTGDIESSSLILAEMY